MEHFIDFPYPFIRNFKPRGGGGGGGGGVLSNILHGGVPDRDPTLNPFIYYFGRTRLTFRTR